VAFSVAGAPGFADAISELLCLMLARRAVSVAFRGTRSLVSVARILATECVGVGVIVGVAGRDVGVKVGVAGCTVSVGAGVGVSLADARATALTVGVVVAVGPGVGVLVGVAVGAGVGLHAVRGTLTNTMAHTAKRQAADATGAFLRGTRAAGVQCDFIVSLFSSFGVALRIL
jgi:hypothetical protein